MKSSYLQYLSQAILANGPSLPAGTHYIPFSLNLPHGAPSTYEGEHGHVRWGQQHKAFFTFEVESWFLSGITWRGRWCATGSGTTTTTVNAELDLNAYSEAALGGRNQDHKNLCCLCCKWASWPSSSFIIITCWTEFKRWPKGCSVHKVRKCKKETSIINRLKLPLNILRSATSCTTVRPQKFLLLLRLLFFLRLLFLLSLHPWSPCHPGDTAVTPVVVIGDGLLQLIIWRNWPLANDHLEGLASCKRSSGGTNHLQTINLRGWPLANDQPEEPASCKWSSGGTSLLQMVICHPHHPRHLCQDPYSISCTFLEQFVLVSCPVRVLGALSKTT